MITWKAWPHQDEHLPLEIDGEIHFHNDSRECVYTKWLPLPQIEATNSLYQHPPTGHQLRHSQQFAARLSAEVLFLLTALATLYPWEKNGLGGISTCLEEGAEAR